LEGRRAVDACFFGLASPVRIKKDGSEVGRPDDHNERERTWIGLAEMKIEFSKESGLDGFRGVA
jgi:hypothetical protein